MYTKHDLKPKRGNDGKKTKPAPKPSERGTPSLNQRAWVSLPSERQASYGGLWEFLASTEFRSLAVRHNGDGSATFTLKGVLEVRNAPLGVYMHGTVAAVEMLPSIIEDLLFKGAWREDMYWRETPP